ncbi:MAG: hypothetical protein M1834_000826 [Cirrosporium novae-zelandiae]|nr:MAG: hypothetical protein M1834_000826 [Cirrosporium novae-zelandiae]
MQQAWFYSLAFACFLHGAFGEGGSGGGGGGGGGGGKSSAAEAAEAAAEAHAEYLNDSFGHDVLIALGSVAIAVVIVNIILHTARYVRHLACLGATNTQRYFLVPNMTWAKIKEHILYAPLFRTRHNREFHLSSALSMGTLPTRFQSLFICGIVGMNVAYCVTYIDWHTEATEYLGALRNRSGTIAVVNLIPLFVMAARNNPLIQGLGISFDTFNLMHRWLGRIIVVEALVHTFAWISSEVIETGSWSAVGMAIKYSSFIMTGLLGTVGFTALLLHSPSAIRHAFYETFLHLHIAFVILALVGVWIHLDGFGQQQYVLNAIIIWAIERFTRFALIMYRNVGSGGTKAVVETLPGDALKVTLKTARPWTFKPGQHIYLYMPSVGLWTSHPFSLAWSEETEELYAEKGIPMAHQDVLSSRKAQTSLIIRRRTGFTNTLFNKAEKNNGLYTATAFVEGPYGGVETLHSYGTVMLFAGGVGVTHQVPHVRDLVAGYANGTVATRKVVLVWVIQNPEHLEWIRPWMTAILAMENRRDILKIMLFVTRPRSTKEIHSPSATVQMFPGRPNIDTLVQMESETQVGAMAVTVCGTGALSDDVRRAVRKRQGHTNIDFVEESFSW